jgi:hypothetical protein
MKKTKTQTEMMKDDEVIRLHGVEDGRKNLSKWTFRPLTALTISWIQRNNVFADNNDMIFKSGAYAYLHTTPFAEIRKVVNDRDAFVEAVDIWIEKNISHHNEVNEIANEMNASFERYSSSVYTIDKKDGQETSSGN